MTEECPEIEALAAYAEHKLSPPESLEIEAHLAWCSVCQHTVIQTVRNVTLFENLTLPDPVDS